MQDGVDVDLMNIPICQLLVALSPTDANQFNYSMPDVRVIRTDRGIGPQKIDFYDVKGPLS